MLAKRQRKKKKPRPADAEEFFAGVAGLLIFLLGVLVLVAGLDLASTMTSKTEGWVFTAIDVRRQCKVDYQYEVNDQTFRIQNYWDGHCGDVRSASSRTVFFDGNAPERSSLENPASWQEIYMAPIIFCGLGGLLLLGGGPAVLKRFRNLLKKR